MAQPTRILIALIAGLALGSLLAGFHPDAARYGLAVADPAGKLWLDALKMTIVPLVFALVVTGVASAAGAASAGGLAARTLALFALLLASAAAVSALLTPALLALWPPSLSTVATLRAGSSDAPDVGATASLGDWLSSIIPTNPVAAAADGAILQLVLFGLAFGFAAAQISDDARQQLVRTFQAICDAMLVIVHWVLWATPVGVFALAFGVGARNGLAAAGILAHYVTVISLVCIAILLLSYALAAAGGGVSPARFGRAALPSQMVALSTQSSLASLPAMIAGAQDRLGIPPRIAGLVLPMAVAIFRASSPAANLAVAIYLAHLHGVELAPATLGVGAAVAVLISLAGVGVASSVTFFTTIAPICIAMGVPLDMLPLLLAVETIPDIFRTVATATADLAVTSVVAAQEEKAAAVPQPES